MPLIFRVLVVDDDPLIRRMVIRVMSVLGTFEFNIAANGLEGLAALRYTDSQGESRPCHLVVSDIQMPRLNGLEMVQQACAQGLLNMEVTPVIFMTGSVHPTVLATAGALARSVVDKPFTAEELRKAVMNALGISHS